MRAFIAVDISEEIRAKTSKIIREFQSLDINVKFVEPGNLHFTVKFLGEIKENQIDSMRERIKNACEALEPFKISLKGVSYFGKPNYIRTLFVGTDEGRDEFVKMVNKIEKNLKSDREGKFSPHLTIGRVKSGKNKECMLKLIEKYSEVNIGEMKVNDVKLKKSTLTAKGPVYEDVFTVDMGA